MKLSGGEKRVWAFCVTLSLLLHAVVIFSPLFPLRGKKYAEPGLKLTARTLSAAPEPVSPRIAETRKVARQEAEPGKNLPRPKPRQGAEQKNIADIEKAAGGNAAEAPDGISEKAASSASPDDAGQETSAGNIPPRAAADAPIADLNRLRVTKKILPEYSAFSRKRKEEGRVGILVTIRDGAVIAAEIYESSGHKRLDAAALRAARQWRFGGGGETRTVIPFIFRITDEKEQ